MRTGARPYTATPSPRQRFASLSSSAGAPSDLRGLTAAMHRYLEHLGMEGYTPIGRYNVERYIREFIAWADERGVTHPQQVTRAVLERYQRWLYHYRKKDGAPLAATSQRGKIIPLRGFFKWLTRSGEIPANPAADLDLPRQIKRLPHAVLTAGEAERVLASVDIGTPIGLRDRAMMEVLYATGMRRMELSGLAIDDLDVERVVVLIRLGKGQKDRLIPLGERALHWVQLYLDEAREQFAWNQNDRTLFLGNEGHPLHPMWLSTLIANRVAAAGVDKRGGCHLWRHTMATLMLEGGADIRHIQAMLGHADISSTQIYTQVAIRQLQRVHAQTHPAVRLRARQAHSDPDGGEPRPEANDAASALLEALAGEAEDDDA
ncbi:site-specific tyrosine recombinase XerC [Variovorax ginsengisoli]|uniref:Site-specific tyrosine recombinase XerC n=1 Tax=Variovorax ginsengisoli TaxID=363844 RepID=A0ABT8SEZ8_9BURK|nr:site-specific tyrosine recombinase XerC [Variovorax ginsengisoli]MDN8618326.1 site-specific tyrosine recombinase XerC [Variovorax ginsengisoli]MDO1537496.1 site-specific tyrosine recombinase XerC [Variovorax ginsengisoli]